MNVEEMDLNEDTIIAFAQRERLKLLAETEDNPKLRVKILDSLSSTAVGIKRIKTEDANAASDRSVAAAMVETLKGISENPFMLTAVNHSVKMVMEPVLPQISILPDEDSLEPSTLTYTDIVTD